MYYKKYVPIMKALSDETRIQIVDMLKAGEMCACKILEKFEITQPTLSYHMKVLTGSGLVKGYRDGAWMHYSLNEDVSGELSKFFSELVSADTTLACTSNKVEVEQ